MSDKLKQANIEKSLAVVEDCLLSLPGTGEVITTEVQLKIEKAKSALSHLKDLLLGNGNDPGSYKSCTSKRPSTSEPI